MDERKLLKAIYRSIEWDKLYRLAPDASREQVDELFGRLGAPAEAPSRRKTAPAGALPHAALLHCDGASSGNPGPAGIGMVLAAPDGTELQAWGAFIGRATNNVAEYRALIAGLARALELGIKELKVRCDSQLLVRQITGAYKVKSPALRKLHAEALDLLERFDRWSAQHISRVENERADNIAGAQVRKHKKSKRDQLR